jgi:methylated-DNA-[protein]-cysteine S-methyltransferase
MIFQTNIGPISLGYNNDRLICEFGSHKVEREPSKQIAAQLVDYFAGNKTTVFTCELPDGPAFTRKCWEACRNIPFGETRTYAELAKSAGSPKAVRAAGQAMRKNPQVIITPCHRVISSSGKLHGFAGTIDPQSKELQRKHFLFTFEKGIMTA